MQSHDESPCSDVIGKPREADEDDGGHVMDDLLLEILQKRFRLQGIFFLFPSRHCSLFLPLAYRSPFPSSYV
jgi:hypothetical protein